MPKVKYKTINFGPDRQAVIDQATTVIEEYEKLGYDLTLRQLYYRFVAMDLFPTGWKYVQQGGKWKRDPDGTNNAEPNYKLLGDIIGDARLAGLIDWHAIEDRTRKEEGNSHWATPADIVDVCARQFALDKWADQPYRVEVWVEKDALKGVVGQAARAMDVQFFSCRGYASLTSFWDAGQRLKQYAVNGQKPVILHLGDHDPSGIDMSRDIEERVGMFMDGYAEDLKFERVALNMPQVKKYSPPPNPAKVTDSRYNAYQELYGDESWELDALEPSVLDALIRERVGKYLNPKLYAAKQKEENEHKTHLSTAARHWNGEVTELLENL